MTTGFYIAAPFFSDEQKKLVADVEKALEVARFEYYSPSKHGIVLDKSGLTEDQFKLIIKSIFIENVEKISSYEYLTAILYHFDIGTLFEVGYKLGNCLYPEKHESLKEFSRSVFLQGDSIKEQVLKFVDIMTSNEVKICLEHDSPVYQVFTTELLNSSAPILNIGKYNFICIDERPIVAFLLMGVFYARGINFMTYSTKNYGSNVMIAASALAHYKLNKDISELSKSEVENLVAMVANQVSTLSAVEFANQVQ